jgi:hypothetical protein
MGGVSRSTGCRDPRGTIWARLGSNQRPLACEAIHLRLQFLEVCRETARPSPSAHHEFQGIPWDLGQRRTALTQKRAVPGDP